MHFRIGNREVSLHHLKLAGDLSRERKWLLGARLLPQSPSATNPFSMLYENAKQSLRSRDLDAATLSIMRLRWFRERLTEVAHHDYKLARLFFRRLRTNSLGDYFGALCELNNACILISRNLPFKCPDPPDFEVQVDRFLSANLECTSTHLSGESGKALNYKIESAIADKKQKAYANDRTALIIDTTNVMFFSHKGGHDMNPQGLREHINESVKECGFGAIILQSQIGDFRPNGLIALELVYERIDGKTTSVELKALLDMLFPAGEHLLMNPIFPRL